MATTAMDLLLSQRYGNWTGPGYSAAVTSPSFVPHSIDLRDVRGVDDLDHNGFRPLPKGERTMKR